MSKFKVISFGLFAVALLGLSHLPVFAQNDAPADALAPANKPNTFGNFEVGLPGLTEKSIDSFVGKESPILDYINLIVNVVIAVLVIIGLIMIVIAGYMYMTAGGDASQVKTAKSWVLSALAGIFLSLVSVIILTTVNKFIGSGAEEPKLGETSNGAGGSGAGGSGAGSGSGDGSGSGSGSQQGGSLPGSGSTAPGGSNTGGSNNTLARIYKTEKGTPIPKSEAYSLNVVADRELYVENGTQLSKPAYYIDGKRVQLSEVAQEVNKLTGSEVSGVQVTVYRAKSLPSYEDALYSVFKSAGLTENQIYKYPFPVNSN